ncbi:MAG: DUF4920 domain-containing protein [Chitinophagaceae bacterium]|nr:DUF4920 domain-containing protein [Chitinophagaceae bacterium]
MKILLAVLCFFAFSFTKAQPPAGEANPGDQYGSSIDEAKAIPVSQLPALLQNKKSISTKIKAKVLDVCPKKGCWLKLEVNDSTTAFVKMKDYAFFLPAAIKGKYIVMDGEASIKTISVNELRHYAEDAKKTKEEINAIIRPEQEIRLIANGIVVAK